MLLYISLILDSYEKDVNRINKDIIRSKDFKYPPILPIIYYNGTREWTADKNFLDRTEMNNIFEKYIPKFEYELISLNKYSVADLAKFGNALSLFMIISKIKSASDFAIIKEAPVEYYKELDSMKIPQHLKELLTKVIAVLLTKANVPPEEIDALTKNIDERGLSEMISLEDYDVQATRREARQEGRAEIINGPLNALVKTLLIKGHSIPEIASMMEMTEADVKKLLPNLTLTAV